MNAAPTNLGGTPTLNHFLIGSGQWGFLGGKGFFLSGPAYDAGSNVLTLFEVVFMETAGYIIVGAICERITFWAFLLCELFIGAILYPDFRLLGVGRRLDVAAGHDDAPGPRLRGFRGLDRRPRRRRLLRHGAGGHSRSAAGQVRTGRQARAPFPAHNIVFVVTGTFILLFGWMGFNPGSTLGATDLRISVVAVNTNLAAVAGAATAMLFWYLMFGKPDISMACNGMLAGLVAITAPCAFVGPNAAVVIGILAGVIVCAGVLFNERVLKVDDPCGAISVHGYCGWFGAVCVGIFADGTYGAGWNGVGAATYLGKAGRA